MAKCKQSKDEGYWKRAFKYLPARFRASPYIQSNNGSSSHRSLIRIDALVPTNKIVPINSTFLDLQNGSRSYDDNVTLLYPFASQLRS